MPAVPTGFVATPGARVLVVEDELVVRRLMQEILCTHFGCRVEVAENGAEALSALSRGPYALVISDIRMPVMDGREFYLRLKDRHPETARRFVFTTGHVGQNELEAELAQWNVPVVAKPFKVSRLTEVCRPFLQHEANLRTCA
jgi:CheY-like chemotaxis protein